MGLNHTNPPAVVPAAAGTDPIVALAVPQPGHLLDPLSRPMSTTLGGQEIPAHAPGFFASSPSGPSPANWPNSGFQPAASNRQLFVGNVCVSLLETSAGLISSLWRSCPSNANGRISR